MTARRIADLSVHPIGLGAMPLSDPAMLAERPRALATVHAQSGQTAIALKWAEKWAQSAPTDPRSRQLISRLRGEN